MKKFSHKNVVYLKSEAALKMINYDEDKCILEATFNNNRTYHYENVAKKVWMDFLGVIRSGNSAGEFINQHIKPFYKCSEIT